MTERDRLDRLAAIAALRRDADLARHALALTEREAARKEAARIDQERAAAFAVAGEDLGHALRLAAFADRCVAAREEAARALAAAAARAEGTAAAAGRSMARHALIGRLARAAGRKARDAGQSQGEG